jgi:class 3 adenylate cyclase
MPPQGPYAPRRATPSSLVAWILVVVVPLAMLLVLRLAPPIDEKWENHPAHFWLVLGSASIATTLGYVVSVAARNRRDARLFLISLAFISSAGFLGLHALATPGVLLGKNAGFELATPVGLLVGGALVALSGLDFTPATSRRIIAHSQWLLAICLGLIALWGAVSLAGVGPLNQPLQEEELNGWQAVLGAAGVAFYALGGLGYYRLYRKRGARFAFEVAVAFTLLAEAMVVVAFAQNWEVSWWEWHVLMISAFVLIALSARGEWHEERFSALYLDETLAGTREASILFADLQQFTPYSERTDPADVAAMLNAYFGQLVPMLAAVGGEVHQLIGDAIMVVFNKEGNQPDHALLAGRSALALQREATALAKDHPDWPRFRVGVNSGEVLAGVIGGESGHRKHGLVGDTVNLAARLETAAPVGEVVIGAGTYARLPAGALVERMPPLRLKGKSEPVEAYILRAVP